MTNIATIRQYVSADLRYMTLLSRPRGGRTLRALAANMAMSLFSRYCDWRRTYPMSSGIKRVRLDEVDDSLALCKESYCPELAPLPQRLQLPTAKLPRTSGRITAAVD